MDQDTSLEHLRDKSIFTTGEAAELCRVSQQTIIRCFDNGRLQGFRVPGSKFRRIPRAELLRFMRANEIPLGMLGETRHTALLVDDDPETVRRIEDSMASDGEWSLIVANNALEAGMELERATPDLLIVDAALPDLDPAAAFSRIRGRERFANLRIVFTGGAGDDERLRHARLAGGEVLRKPFEIESLRKLMRNGGPR
jgi:excisionase family DNA binding protein